MESLFLSGVILALMVLLTYALHVMRRQEKEIEALRDEIFYLQNDLKLREAQHSLAMWDQRREMNEARWTAEDKLYKRLYPQPDEGDTTQR